jgi:NAD(P)-dependent dehydrogenase (short-subunit alcohol dehydrogenase family)
MTAALLEGKVAVVSGAGSVGYGWGNGKATAVLFARHGAEVIALDRDLNAAEETAAMIEREGGKGRALRVDVSRVDEVEAAFAAILREHGRIDVLHNNVGIGVPGGAVEATEASWDLVHRVNLKSMFLTCKHALPGMAERRSGAIVNVSSLAGMRWWGVSYLSYSTSKAAVNQLTRTIAAEYAPRGIRCNAIVPGLIDTPTIYVGIADDGASHDRIRAEHSALSPSGKLGDAWDVAEAALFLASDEARYITGALLPVDAGLAHQVAEPGAFG